jgi:hypothetical protein
MLSKHELALLDEYAATNADERRGAPNDDESTVHHTVSYQSESNP